MAWFFGRTVDCAHPAVCRHRVGSPLLFGDGGFGNAHWRYCVALGDHVGGGRFCLYHDADGRYAVCDLIANSGVVELGLAQSGCGWFIVLFGVGRLCYGLVPNSLPTLLNGR